MKDLKEILGGKAFANAKESKDISFQKPMLATLTKEYFNDPEWIYERKLDGVRCVATISNSDVQLFTRNEKSLTNTYPEIAEALEQQNMNLILDGEIVAFNGQVSSFSKLQNRMGTDKTEKVEHPEIAVYYYVFDVLQYDSYDLTGLELNWRKKVLNSLDFSDPIRRTAYRRENGKGFHEKACKKGWEGVIAKDGTAGYSHSRSKKWLKFKCTEGQELVIAGYTAPDGERKGFGALLVGFYKGDDLKYAGKVGTGYDDNFLEDFISRLQQIHRKTSPFEDFDSDAENIQFVTPKYVGEFSFTEWTQDNKLRHPSFLGLREDKDAKQVIKEV